MFRKTVYICCLLFFAMGIFHFAKANGESSFLALDQEQGISTPTLKPSPDSHERDETVALSPPKSYFQSSRKGLNLYNFLLLLLSLWAVNGEKVPSVMSIVEGSAVNNTGDLPFVLNFPIVSPHPVARFKVTKTFQDSPELRTPKKVILPLLRLDSANPDLKNFLPQNSSAAYVAKANKVLKNILKGQKPILDDRYVLQLNSGIDHGFSFPANFDVLSHLLSLCVRDPGTMKQVLDVGAGYGYDSILALLTGKVVIEAVDIYDKQIAALRDTVSTQVSSVDKNLMGRFNARNLNFVTHPIPAEWRNNFHILNANKVPHFLTEDQTDLFLDRAFFTTRSGGHLVLTSLAPDVGSALEAFLNKNREVYSCPGFVHYETTQSISTLRISPERNIRRAKKTEQPGQFDERLDPRNPGLILRTRVMNYHDTGTLSRLVENHGFRVLTASYYVQKGDDGSFERMVYVVAEKPFVEETIAEEVITSPADPIQQKEKTKEKPKEKHRDKKNKKAGSGYKPEKRKMKNIRRRFHQSHR